MESSFGFLPVLLAIGKPEGGKVLDAEREAHVAATKD